MPEINILKTFSNLILITTSQNRFYYCAHPRNGETETESISHLVKITQLVDHEGRIKFRWVRFHRLCSWFPNPGWLA